MTFVRNILRGKERGIAGRLREAGAAELAAEGDAGDAQAPGRRSGRSLAIFRQGQASGIKTEARRGLETLLAGFGLLPIHNEKVHTDDY